LFDAQGSTRALTSPSQAVTDTFLYDMWGKELATTGSINFLRHRWIGELGYYYDKDLA